MQNLRILNGALLIAGTCIGGGMLALPVICAHVGFIPTLFVMLGIWAFMTSTAYLYFEVTLWMEKDSHLISMANRFLGTWGKRICGTVFAFICYSSLTAYLSGGGRMLAEVLGENVDGWWAWSYPLYLCLFGGFLLLGTHIAGSINTLLFALMVAVFVLMIEGAWVVNPELLSRQNWEFKGIISQIPMMLTTFSFPGIIPVLASYHQQDVKATKLSVMLGTGLTLVIYVIWLAVVLGNVPLDGPHGLAEALAFDLHACDSLVHFLNKPSLAFMAKAFAFLALGTSFIGLSLSLGSFLSDALGISLKSLKGKLGLFFLIVVPVLLVKLQLEKVFFRALDLSGGLGDGILSGIFPALAVWKGRYLMKLKGPYRFWGEKKFLALILLFSAAVVAYEIVKLILPFLLPR